METLSELVLEDRLQEQKRIALQIEEVLDDEGWELDIEFTPEGFSDLPRLLNEFLETQKVSPEARVQLEVLGRLIKRAAGAAGRVAGEWQRAKSRVQHAKASLRKSFEAGKRRATDKSKGTPPAPAPKRTLKKKPAVEPVAKKPAKRPVKKPAVPTKKKLKPSTKKKLKAVAKPSTIKKKSSAKPTTRRKLKPGEKMVFGKVRKLRNPGARR